MPYHFIVTFLSLFLKPAATLATRPPEGFPHFAQETQNCAKVTKKNDSSASPVVFLGCTAYLYLKRGIFGLLAHHKKGNDNSSLQNKKI